MHKAPSGLCAMYSDVSFFPERGESTSAAKRCANVVRSAVNRLCWSVVAGVRDGVVAAEFTDAFVECDCE